MDILLNKKTMLVEVSIGKKVLKTESLTPESFKSYMIELAGDRIDMLRTCNKLLKIKSFKFKGVKNG